MSSHEQYDKLLRELPKDGSLSGDFKLNQVDLEYLNSCGYIDTQSSETGGIYLIRLTRQGLKFISEGGFKIEDEQKEKRRVSDELQQENWIATTKSAKTAKMVSIISVIIAALSLLVALLALLK